MSVQKQRDGNIAEDTKQRWNFINPASHAIAPDKKKKKDPRKRKRKRKIAKLFLSPEPNEESHASGKCQS